MKSLLLSLLMLAFAWPSSAQWNPVADVPVGAVYSVFASGDTILAGADSLVYISTNGGASFKKSAPVFPQKTPVTAARIHGGRIYAGTFGKGVFFSTNLGDTWNSFNQGLVGGAFNTQLFISDLVIDNNKMVAATGGDGAWKRDLVAAGSWGHFGNVFAPDQAENLNSITVGGTRLLTCGGSNGMVFFRDPGDSEWTESFLNNVGLGPGHSGQTAIWTGSVWLVGEASGVFHSTQGQSPWTLTDIGIGALQNVRFALHGTRVFAAFRITTGAIIEFSDDGVSWQFLDFIPGGFVLDLAIHGNDLYAAQTDGLWVRDISTVATKPMTWGSVKSLYRKPIK
jgi:hypothetical protein